MSTIEYKQVGSSCLKEFTGVDPAWAASAFTFMSDLGSLTSDSEFGGFGSAPALYTIQTVVASACTAVRCYGWVKAAAWEGIPTKSTMGDILLNGGRTIRGHYIEPITDADIEQADKVIALTLSSTETSDYAHNLRVAMSHEFGQVQHYGLIAAAAGLYSANVAKIEAAKKAAEATADKSNEFVGNEKDKLNLVLTILSVSERSSNYGVQYLTKMEDEAGNAFTWWGSRPLNQGATYEGTWTVKKHTTFNDRNETVIFRPAKNLTEK